FFLLRLAARLVSRKRPAVTPAWFLGVAFLVSIAVMGLRIAALVAGIFAFDPPASAPIKPVPASTIASFADEDIFESIAIDRAGNMFISVFTKGEIRKVTPDGKESLFAKLPVGELQLAKASGVVAALVVGKDDVVYANVNSSIPENRGVWAIA